MKNFKIFSLFTLLALSSCNIDPEYYSEIAPSTFYDSPDVFTNGWPAPTSTSRIMKAWDST